MSPKLKLAWTLVAISIMLPGALLICVEAPGSMAAHLISGPARAPDVAEADYVLAMAPPKSETAGERALRYDGAAQAAAATLRAAPMRPEGWLNLAYARALAARQLTPTAAAAFEQSYAVAPIDPSIVNWRVHFAYEGWTALTPSAQQKVIAEEGAIWRRMPAARPGLVAAVTSVSNPLGRAAGQADLSKLGGLPGGDAKKAVQ